MRRTRDRILGAIVGEETKIRWVTMQLRCCSYSGCPGPPKWSKQFLIISETKTRQKDFNPQAETSTATHQLSPPTKRQHWLTTLVIVLSVLVNIAFFMFHDSLKPSMPQSTCKAQFLAKTLRTPTKSSPLSPASKSRRTCPTDEFLANSSTIDDEKSGSFCQFEAQYQEFQRQSHHGHSQPPLQRSLLIPSPLEQRLQTAPHFIHQHSVLSTNSTLACMQANLRKNHKNVDERCLVTWRASLTSFDQRRQDQTSPLRAPSIPEISRPSIPPHHEPQTTTAMGTHQRSLEAILDTHRYRQTTLAAICAVNGRPQKKTMVDFRELNDSENHVSSWAEKVARQHPPPKSPH